MVLAANTSLKTMFDSPEKPLGFAVKVFTLQPYFRLLVDYTFRRVIWRGADAGRFAGLSEKAGELLKRHPRMTGDAFSRVLKAMRERLPELTNILSKELIDAVHFFTIETFPKLVSPPLYPSWSPSSAQP
jgi:hypothetical protein